MTEDTSKIYVVYHSADLDGQMCRAIAERWLNSEAGRVPREIHYVGWDYGEASPIIPENAKIFMMDVCIPALMYHPYLVWIDHHKTSLERFHDIPGMQIDGVAACRLAWQWFFGSHRSKTDFVERRVTEPWAVRLAGEYDVWDKRDRDAELFNLGMKMATTEWEYWGNLLDGNHTVVQKMIDCGSIIWNYKSVEDASILHQNCFDMNWEGLNFLVLNTARCNSISFLSGVQEHHDALLGFTYTGQMWKVGMYSTPHKPDIDLSAIAKKHGGGGHRGACGFQSSTLPFMEQIMRLCTDLDMETEDWWLRTTQLSHRSEYIGDRGENVTVTCDDCGMECSEYMASDGHWHFCWHLDGDGNPCSFIVGDREPNDALKAAVARYKEGTTNGDTYTFSVAAVNTQEVK